LILILIKAGICSCTVQSLQVGDREQGKEDAKKKDKESGGKAFLENGHRQAHVQEIRGWSPSGGKIKEAEAESAQEVRSLPGRQQTYWRSATSVKGENNAKGNKCAGVTATQEEAAAARQRLQRRKK